MRDHHIFGAQAVCLGPSACVVVTRLCQQVKAGLYFRGVADARLCITTDRIHAVSPPHRSSVALFAYEDGVGLMHIALVESGELR